MVLRERLCLKINILSFLVRNRAYIVFHGLGFIIAYFRMSMEKEIGVKKENVHIWHNDMQLRGFF